MTVYQDSSLPEFVVKRSVFEQSCKVKTGTRVKMWFANDASRKAGKSGGMWYHGVVLNNNFPNDAEPWECVQVRWESDTELTMACPWVSPQLSPHDSQPSTLKP